MRILFSVAALVFLAGSTRAGELDLKLTVEEPSGLARQACPVSGGIPLPPGAFKKDQAFAVFAGGAEVPAQVLPLSADENGVLRWVLIDAQVDLGAKEKKSLTLRAVKGSAAPAATVKVTDDAAGVTVDTGKVRFTIAKDKPFSLFSAVEAGGKPVAGGGETSYTDSFDGKRYVADKPSSVVVEYAGPMRTTVCAKGRFVGDEPNKFRYAARVTAWAGRSEVHVKYSLSNSNEDHYSWRRVKDSTVVLKLAAEPAGTIVGAGKPLDAGKDVWMQQTSRVFKAAIHGEDSMESTPWYHQTPGASGPGGAKARDGDKDLWTSSGKGDVSEGWIAAKLGGAVVLAADLYFVEDPPRRLAVEKGALVLGGIAEPLEGAARPFKDKGRWLVDCSHLSSQYLLDFAAPAAAAEISAEVRAAKARSHVMAAPAWYFESDQLASGRFGTQEDEIACYKKWGWKFDEKEIPKAPGGIWANCPRWACGDDNHYTSEQDSLDAVLNMYLRTGGRAFFDVAESWANYFMDLQVWRTDGWKYKDGGVWWLKGDGRGPLGNRPQRAKDPVTGDRENLYNAMKGQQPYGPESGGDLNFLARAKECYCHNWGEGLCTWFCLTGDRDALEAAADCVEQCYDTQKRAFGKVPGKTTTGFSRDFTRSCYMANALRLCQPTDAFAVEVSDFMAQIYLQRPLKEPRGMVNVAEKMPLADMQKLVGAKGMDKMKELGVTYDEKTGELNDPKTGAKWLPVANPCTFMYPPISRAMESYWRITGNEDARDWDIAYGQAAAHVFFQPKHGQLDYGGMLVDFPVKGWAWDKPSWELPEDSKDGAGRPINGYLACFHPDICARAYFLCGEPFLKQRAYDYWYYGSHRGYNAPQMSNVGRVGYWSNTTNTHDEKQPAFSSKTFYIWAHERSDAKPPAAVADLKVAVQGEKATVSFTAPADEGGGKAARYQVKCSDKPIVAYEKFLELWKENKDAGVTNFWMAANLKDEPAPQAAGAKESFTVSGVPANAKFFVVVSFDDSVNRSAPSNVAEAGK
ncbi:MAG TPA: hypothetical protein PK280_09735 [Planctomycetota bacterium]|nr:hypothetical protein [Planctomycetota bacterium]